MTVAKFKAFISQLNVSSQLNPKDVTHDDTIRIQLIRQKFSHCVELVKDVEKLRSLSDRIIMYAHEYDLDERTPYNGHRTLLKIAKRFEYLLLTPAANYNHLDTLRKVAAVLIKTLENIEKMRQLSPGQMFCHDKNYARHLFDQSTSMKDELAAFYGEFNNFWLCRSMRIILNYLYVILVCMIWKPHSIFKTIIDPAFRGECYAEITHNTDIRFVKFIWNLNEIWIYRLAILIVLYGFGRPATRRTLYLDTRFSNEFVINPVSGKLEREDKCRHIGLRIKPKIRCRFLRQKFDKSNETLVFHVHGAGFVAQTPDSHDSYLLGWALKLKTVPILSIDYSLLPEAHYPIPYQEVLDVYLWLTSPKSRNAVEKSLGFVPKKFVFAGDSAGASLCISITLMISDARKLVIAENKVNGFLILFPSAIVAMYPVVNLTYSPSVSKFMCGFETILTNGIILEIARYMIRQPEDDPFIDRVDKEGKRVAWYRLPDRHESVAKINKRASHPYVSSVYYQDFESLKSVRLYMISGEFDPMLDDAIAIGREWRGPVILDVMPNMPHGFLYFLSMSVDAKDAVDHCTNRVVEACFKD